MCALAAAIATAKSITVLTDGAALAGAAGASAICAAAAAACVRADATVDEAGRPTASASTRRPAPTLSADKEHQFRTGGEKPLGYDLRAQTPYAARVAARPALRAEELDKVFPGDRDGIRAAPDRRDGVGLRPRRARQDRHDRGPGEQKSFCRSNHVPLPTGPQESPPQMVF